MKRTFIPPRFRPRVKGEKMEPSLKEEDFFSPNPDAQEMIEKNGPVCLYIKDDCSQINAIKMHNDSIDLTMLLYDDLGLTWTFSYYKGQLIFYYKNQKIKPTGIYNRPFFPDGSHPRFNFFNNFLRALDAWEGSLIGANLANFHNASKAYQLTTTIREAIQIGKFSSIDFPKSYFIKGAKKFNKIRRNSDNLIVKSSSGIRSEVATGKHFMKWNLKNLEHLPVFFQKACFGPDIRVHKLDENHWPIILNEKKGSIDYRYAKRGHFETMKFNSALKEFCSLLGIIENIRLIGVDFIKVGRKYYCLESNPSPGWAGFHRVSGEEKEIVKLLTTRISGECREI